MNNSNSNNDNNISVRASRMRSLFSGFQTPTPTRVQNQTPVFDSGTYCVT